MENFGDQLLYLRNLPATSPDGVFYPELGRRVAQRVSAARRNCCFESIIKENRNVVDLLTADYTFLNERLAQHYGIPEYLRLAVPPRDASDRIWPIGGDCWGRAALLSLTWVQNFRTSPVKRGVWVLENILGTPPPEPPPNVPPLEDSKGDEQDHDSARADDDAPQDGALRQLPQADGPHRIRAGELRRGREVANEAGRRRRRSAGYLGGAVGRHEGRTVRSSCGRRCCAIRRSLSARSPRS